MFAVQFFTIFGAVIGFEFIPEIPDDEYEWGLRLDLLFVRIWISKLSVE